MDQTSESEKELQRSKYNEIIDILLTAGYYKAQIHNLSEFDKVVGGFCWCITSSGEEVDVDILFQENCTIGQKIALSESLVKALRKMGCPHPIQPHQIQGGVGGSDYPAIQRAISWLIKKYFENKGERDQKLRSFSTFQFSKYYQLPDESGNSDGISDNLKKILLGRPKATRLYKRQEAINAFEETRVRACLLEYGESFIAKRQSLAIVASTAAVSSPGTSAVSDKQQQIWGDKGHIPLSTTNSANSDVTLQSLARLDINELSGFEKQLAKAAREAEKDELLFAEIASKEEVELKKHMMEINGEAPLAVTGTVLGSIVSQGGTNEMTTAFAAYQSELDQSQKELENNVASGKLGMTAAFQRQKQHLLRQYDEVATKEVEVLQASNTIIAKVKLVQEEQDAADLYVQKLNAQNRKLDALEAAASQQKELKALRDLVTLNESMKAKEKAFKATCKEKMLDYTNRIKVFDEEARDPDNEDNRRLTEVEDMHRKVQTKHSRIKAALGEVNLEVSKFSRTIDDTPTRTELIQYERRFMELYQQQVWKLEETKKYYDMYNTHESTLTYLQKEVKLLNSISENFEEAMKTTASKQEFSRQFKAIVHGVDASLKHQENILATKDTAVEELKSEHQNLVEQQRRYFKAVRDFQEECNKNDWLTTRHEQLLKGS